MKASKIVLALLACALSTQPIPAQTETAASSNRVLGYFDQATGGFHPISQAGEFDSDSVAAINASAGSIVVNFTITIKSAIPTTYPINCGVSATVVDVSTTTANVFSESATVIATRTGATAKCKVTLPYSWALQNPATARVTIVSTLSAGKATATTGLVNRLSTAPIASIPVPANGTTRTENVTAVL